MSWWPYKSLPADSAVPDEIDVRGWSMHRDLMTPIAVLRETALAHNLARMRAFCHDHDVRIAPHGKTTMSPELVRRQLEHDAWGMTAATAWQARAMIAFGAGRVVIANECIDPVGLRWVAEHVRDHPGHEIFCFADSIAVIDAMREILAGVPGAPPLPVLVEVGPAGGRAGARTVADAVAVGAAVARTPELELAGVAGFEGAIAGTREPGRVEEVRRFLTTIRRTAEALIASDLIPATRPVIVSAGGSVFFDEVTEIFTAERATYGSPVEVVIRSGCYLTHDHGSYARNSPFAADGDQDFQPALEVWARVISAPEPGLALLDAGKRDVSHDAGMPVPIALRRSGTSTALPAGLVVDHLNDQHAYLRGGGLQVGDVVGLGIAHPCTTFDKWRAIPVVDDEDNVISVVRTFF